MNLHRQLLVAVTLCTFFAGFACEPRKPGPAGGGTEPAPAPPPRKAFQLDTWSIEPTGAGYRIVSAEGEKIGKVLIRPGQVKIRIGGQTRARVKARRNGFKLAEGDRTILTGKKKGKGTMLTFGDQRETTVPTLEAAPTKGLSAEGASYLKLPELTPWQRLALAVWADEGARGRR